MSEQSGNGTAQDEYTLERETQQVELRLASIMANQLLSLRLKTVHLHTITNWLFCNAAESILV